MKLAHIIIIALLVSVFVGTEFPASAEAQPFGVKPAVNADVPRIKPGSGALVGPTVPGQHVRKIDCFDESAYARAKNKDKDLAGAQLCGADLKKIFLPGADLTGANLSGADLGEARLEGAMLQGATLSRANLAGASLSSSNLEGARLDGANLRESRVSSANLKGADLSRADLAGAILDRKSVV